MLLETKHQKVHTTLGIRDLSFNRGWFDANLFVVDRSPGPTIYEQKCGEVPKLEMLVGRTWFGFWSPKHCCTSEMGNMMCGGSS